MPPLKSAYVENLTWDDVEQNIAQGAIGVLSIGAASKEHGWHMPMNTDWIQAKWYEEQAMSAVHCLVWPTVGYGYYPAFTDFAGSCTLKESTFTNLIEDICGSIFKSGVQKLFIINTGVSTKKPLIEAVKKFKSNVFLHHANEGVHLENAKKQVCVQQYGTHADEAETSFMMAISPQSVIAEKRSLTSHPMDFKFELRIAKTEKDHVNYSPSGVYGDATLATLQKGEAIKNAKIQDLNHSIALFTKPM